MHIVSTRIGDKYQMIRLFYQKIIGKYMHLNHTKAILTMFLIALYDIQ